MEKKRFLEALDALRKTDKAGEKLAKALNEFNDSVDFVFKTSPAEKFILNMLKEEYSEADLDLITDYLYPIFEVNYEEKPLAIYIGSKEGKEKEYKIKNDLDLYYCLEFFLEDGDALYALSGYIQDLKLRYEPIMETYKYVYDNIDEVIESSTGNVKVLAEEFKVIKEKEKKQGLLGIKKE